MISKKGAQKYLMPDSTRLDVCAASVSSGIRCVVGTRDGERRPSSCGPLKFDTKELTPLALEFSDHVIKRIREVDFAGMYHKILDQGTYEPQIGLLIDILDLIHAANTFAKSGNSMPQNLSAMAGHIRTRLLVSPAERDKLGRATQFDILIFLVICDAYINHGKEINGNRVKTLEQVTSGLYM